MPPARVDVDGSPDFVLRRRGGAFRRRPIRRSPASG